MIERIELLIVETERLNASTKTTPMIPNVLEILYQLLKMFKSDRTDQHSLWGGAYGLAALVMDDYRFSDGPLGQKLMRLANDIMEENKK